MLRLSTHIREMSPAVIEWMSLRHSRSARLCRCQSVSSKSSALVESEYKPIQKLLVANRGIHESCYP